MVRSHAIVADDNHADSQWSLKTDPQILFDSLPIGIAISEDAACRKVRGNAEFYRIFNFKRGKLPLSAQLRNPKFRIFHRGKELNRFHLPLQRAIRTRKPVRDYVLDIVFPDGRQLQLLTNANPLRSPDGSVHGAVAVYITVKCPDNPGRVSIDPNSRVSQLLIDLISQADRRR